MPAFEDMCFDLIQQPLRYAGIRGDASSIVNVVTNLIVRSCFGRIDVIHIGRPVSRRTGGGRLRCRCRLSRTSYGSGGGRRFSRGLGRCLVLGGGGLVRGLSRDGDGEVRRQEGGEVGWG